MQSQSIRVLVVDDHQLMIDGLRSILQDEHDVASVDGANSASEALSFLEKNQTDVVLADINMPERSGIDLTRDIKEHYPHIQILALTMHEDISMISKMVEAGASGYILKRTNMNEVLEAIRVVANNGKYLGRDVQEVMMNSLASVEKTNQDEADEGPAPLTTREKEILNLIAKEFSNIEIADKLFISERTVETHRRNIFTKTKTKSIVGLIKYAIKEGLVNHDIDFMKN